MNKLSTVLLLLLLLTACKGGNSSLTVEGLEMPDKSKVYLSKLVGANIELIDSASVKAGKAKFVYSLQEGEPEYMYLSDTSAFLSSFIGQNSEHLKLKFSDSGLIVEGSEDTELLQRLIEKQNDFYDELAGINNMLVQAQEQGDKPRFESLNKELSKLYITYKRDAVKFIMTNKSSVVSVHLLYQNLLSKERLFDPYSDIQYFREVLNALREVYPTSRYVKLLAADVSQAEKDIKIDQMLQGAELNDYPPISLNDINGERVDLSSLKNKRVILSFWLASNDLQKMYNLELKLLYDSYKSKGYDIEIYQVSLDSDKHLWASVVDAQELEWISVNDPAAMGSIYLSSYNLSSLPAFFEINPLLGTCVPLNPNWVVRELGAE